MTDRIEKTIELKAPVSRVWRALTDHDEFGTWFRVKLEGPFVPGRGLARADDVSGLRAFRWEAVVQKIEPERLFSFTWHPYADRSERGLFRRAADARRIHAGEDRQPAHCCTSSNRASTSCRPSVATRRSG